jgi:hypothetical protein
MRRRIQSRIQQISSCGIQIQRRLKPVSFEFFRDEAASQKADPSLHPAPAKMRREGKARDFVRDDTHFKNKVDDNV